MKCDSVTSEIASLAARTIDADRRSELMAHIDDCEDCRAALRGAEALAELRQREVSPPPEHLFAATVAAVTQPRPARRLDRRFWAGTGVGAALAASLFALALVFGWGAMPEGEASPTFVVSLEEPRMMNVAFETDRALEGAKISILLSGNVAIDGYGSTRELSWSEDLDAGVNRLSLPVIANGIDGGQIVVRLEHPLSEQMFVVNLSVDG